MLSTILLLFHITLQQTHQQSVQQLQKAKHRVEIQKSHKDYYDDCVFTKRYSIQQRLKKYPFNKAVKIVAVSYHFEYPEPTIYIGKDGKQINRDSGRISSPAGLHIENGTIDTKTLIEFIALNEQQANALTNIIYNTDYRIKDKIAGISLSGCFEPRNALIFLDKNGKAFDYIEICFHCADSKSLSNKITIGTLCTQKYDLLKKYFLKLGIKTGTLEK